MTKITYRSGLRAEVGSLRDALAVALDLGFAKEKRSCGLAWKNFNQPIEKASLQFGECVERVSQLLKSQSKAVLIIEAPLSGLFSSRRNPLERGGFEKRKPGGKADRHWYSGAGAATCLAAVFFLRELLSALRREVSDQTGTTEIVLYEGFESFKSAGTDHERDAILLLNSFLGLNECEVISVNVAEGQIVVTVMDVVRGTTSPSLPPAIIIPKKAGAEQVVGEPTENDTGA
jgi:hypothetical protein